MPLLIIKFVYISIAGPWVFLLPNIGYTATKNNKYRALIKKENGVAALKTKSYKSNNFVQLRFLSAFYDWVFQYSDN